MVDVTHGVFHYRSRRRRVAFHDHRFEALLAVFLVAVGWSAVPGWTQRIPGPVTTVERHNGTNIFMVDGQPFTTPVFETYEPLARHFRQFGEAGCRVFGFPANCGAEPWEHSVPVWVGPDVWDFSEFDERVRMILESNPEGLLIPRIHVGAPDWWREAHPAALLRFSDGSLGRKHPYRLWPEKASRTYPSIASTHWRQAMAASLRKLIHHIHESDYADRVFGYHIYGLNTEEWYHYYNEDQLGDYSDNVRIDFRRWLRRKYRHEDHLQAAWGDPQARFESVEVPSFEARSAGDGERPFRNPQTEMPVIDFYQYYNELMAETIDFFCGVAKEATNRQKVVGAFYAYMFEFAGNPESGHLAVQKLLESPNVDFIVVTASYGQRQLGSGGSILRSPHTSVMLHGKVWYEDNDNVSFLFPEVSRRIGDQEWERSARVLAATDSAEETKWIYQRGAGFSLANGLHQSFFDLHGGYFDHPQIMADVADLYCLFERSASQDLSSAAEILVVADEQSVFYTTRHSQLLGQNLYDPPYRLIKCGAPYDAVYLNDLAKLDLQQYKLVIVLNAWHLTDAQTRLLNERLKCDGRTVFWSYTPGLFNGPTRDVERIDALVGMQIEIDEQQLVAPRIEPTPDLQALVSDSKLDSVFGPPTSSSHLVYVSDPEAQPLGTFPASARVVFASKQFPEWQSIFSMTASLPSSLFRAIARSAGVHIYNERDDTLYVNRSYLTINADGAGRRTLSLPNPASVFDAISGEQIGESVTEFDVELRDRETRIFRLEST